MEEKESKSLFRRLTFGTANQVVDFVFIALMLLLLLFAGYARWDSQQVYTQADPIQFIQYKPSPPEMVPFEELQELNPDVLGWLTVYGTNIDYPVVQGEDNEKYLNHSPLMEPQGSGSLFLDYRNRRDFSDFNTIIFGHHMAHHEMFGDLDEFLNEDFWNKHEYGNLIYNNQNHGLQFVAMLQCDAYDFFIYRPGITGEAQKLKYINHLYETAKYVRGVDTKALRNMQESGGLEAIRTSPITPEDHIVLLSTCSADITNGRFILVGKILDTFVENPFPDTTENRTTRGIDSAKLTERLGKWPVQTWIFILILLIIIVLALYVVSNVLYQRTLKGENANDQNTEDD